MGSFDVTDVLLLLGIAQGFFLGITLPIIHQKNIGANKVLALQLLLACLTLLTRMVVQKADAIWLIQRFVLLEAFIFVFGPLGYIYLKRLLDKNQETFRLPWFHYIPALSYFSYLVYINTYSITAFGQSLREGHFSTVFFIAELAALFFNCWYWFLSVRFFRKLVKKEKEQLSFSQSAISFVRVMLGVIGVVLFLWLVNFCSAYFFYVTLPIGNYNFVWIAIPILIYVVGYFALKQPEIFRVSVTDDRPKPHAKIRMSAKGIQELQDSLTELMHKKKIYLNNELTLADLSKQLHTSTNNLSWLLNNVYQSNFYDFVNEYRVNAFVSKLERNEHKAKTLFSLSMEVGFNSKSTFNKAFKAVLNETPSSYIKRLAG